MTMSTASFKKLYETALQRQAAGAHTDQQQQQQQQPPDATTSDSTTSETPPTAQSYQSHSMDYAGFKHMLRCMARRRARVRKLLRKEPDQKLPESVIQHELKVFLTPHTYKTQTNAPIDAGELPHMIGGDIHPMDDDDDDTSSRPEEEDDDSRTEEQTPPRTPLASNTAANSRPHPQQQPSQPSAFQRSSSAPAGRIAHYSFQEYIAMYDGTAATNALSPTNSSSNHYHQQQQPPSAAGDIALPSYYTPLQDGPPLTRRHSQQQQQQQHFPEMETMLQDIHATETFSDVESLPSFSNDAAGATTTNHHLLAAMTPPRRNYHHHPFPRLRVDRRRTKAAVLRKISARERLEMVSFLQTQVHKVYTYYVHRAQHLATRMDPMQQLVGEQQNNNEGYQAPSVTRNDDSTTTNELISPHLLTLLCHDLLDIMAFCTINTVAACQILIRYDAYARTFEGTPMMEYYLKESSAHHGAFRKLLQHAEVHALADSLTQIMISVSTTMVNASSATATLGSSSLEPPSTTTTIAPRSVLDVEANNQMVNLLHDFGQQRTFFQEILHGIFADPSVHNVNKATSNQNNNQSLDGESDPSDNTSRPGWLDANMKRLRSWIEYGVYDVDRLGLEPAYLTTRGKSLNDEMRQLAKWAKRRQASSSSSTMDADEHDGKKQSTEEPQLTGIQVFNLTLNLISAFLYCMNYYIVEPSSTLYVNRLGAHDALSGTLIGMMPLGAFLSSIPFSMWTNKSFRHPFIMSCTLMIAGNIMYSLADRMRSVPMALMGRLIAGLGAPKCIIRRYMADTTPLSLRTSVNASFGMVVAAGSALGPAMAVLLTRIELITKLPVLGWMQFNGLTMPGYFMATLWTTFLMILLLTFDEPDRAGLEEQKRLEMESKIENQGKKSLHGKDDDTVDAAEDDDDVSVNEDIEHNDDDSMEEPLPRMRSGQSAVTEQPPIDELRTIFSKDTFTQSNNNDDGTAQTSLSKELAIYRQTLSVSMSGEQLLKVGFFRTWQMRLLNYMEMITPPVRICLGLLFCKVFTIETLASATSVVSKNRYHWGVRQVGTLGFVNGCLVIPFSITVGRLSMRFQDQKLMQALVGIGCFGFFLLIDLSDLVDPHSRGDYNEGHPLAVGPHRYVTGYFLCYMSIQAFEGVIGSALSKVIPTALASGTLNSGLLATLTDTLGRSCGDLFISAVGFISLRQLMNLLFIPGFCIMLGCFVVIRQYRDLLAV